MAFVPGPIPVGVPTGAPQAGARPGPIDHPDSGKSRPRRAPHKKHPDDEVPTWPSSRPIPAGVPTGAPQAGARPGPIGHPDPESPGRRELRLKSIRTTKFRRGLRPRPFPVRVPTGVDWPGSNRSAKHAFGTIKARAKNPGGGRKAGSGTVRPSGTAGRVGRAIVRDLFFRCKG